MRCIKLKSGFSWSTDIVYKVVDSYEQDDGIVYILNKNLSSTSDESKVLSNGNRIHITHTYRDNECLRMERRYKLDKINF